MHHILIKKQNILKEICFLNIKYTNSLIQRCIVISVVIDKVRLTLLIWKLSVIISVLMYSFSFVLLSLWQNCECIFLQLTTTLFSQHTHRWILITRVNRELITGLTGYRLVSVRPSGVQQSQTKLKSLLDNSPCLLNVFNHLVKTRTERLKTSLHC